MTNRLEHMRALVEAATDGPWTYRRDSTKAPHFGCVWTGEPYADDADQIAVEPAEEDAEFIAASREAIEKALWVVEAVAEYERERANPAPDYVMARALRDKMFEALAYWMEEVDGE